MRRALAIALLLTVPVALVASACGSDDGTDVRSAGGASASGSGSGSSSGPGLSLEDTATVATDDARILAAVAAYTTYVKAKTDDLVATTTTFTDAVRAGDVAAAKSAYARSRASWEAIEPIAGLIPSIDGAVDARVDDFAGVNDPKFTGWHRLEYLLWEKNTTAGGATYADQLDADLAKLRTGIATLDIPPLAMAQGASELIQEVSEGKITGEEDRYSKTDLWDFAANVAGSQRIITELTPALATADPALLTRIQADFTELNAGIDTLRKGDGFVLFCREDDDFPNAALCPATTVTTAQIDTLKGQLAGLSEDLALVPGALGLT